MDLVFGPTSFAFAYLPLASKRSNVNSIRLAAMRYVSATQPYLAFRPPFVSL